MGDLFTYKSFVHALAGATGGITAISIFYPLNTIRTRLQVSDDKEFLGPISLAQKIVREEGGIAALYRGWQAQVVSLGCSNFVYFYTYNGMKNAYVRSLQRQGLKGVLGPGTNLAIASIAGVINVLSTTPLWVVGTRLTVQQKKEASSAGSVAKPYKGIWDCLTRIYKEEGVAALWNGVGPSLVLVSNPTIQFVTYEFCKNILLKRVQTRGFGITAWEFFLIGAIAKAVATVVTYPLQVAQSRLRANRKAAASAGKDDGGILGVFSGTITILKEVFAKHGLQGLYRGMVAKLWQTVLTAAFQFLTYEQIVRFVFKIFLRDQPVEVKSAQMASLAKEK